MADTTARDSVARILATLGIVIFATLIAMGLFRGLKIAGVEALLLAAALIAAMICGLVYGLLAAGAALFASHAFVGLHVWPLDADATDASTVALFCAAIAVTGLYTDAVRRRNRVAHSIPHAARTLFAHASDGGMGSLFALARRDEPIVGQASIIEEAKRTFTSFCIVSVGLVSGVLFRDLVGGAASEVCVLASVILVAGLMGARFGFAAGIFAALMQTGFMAPLAGAPRVGPPETAFAVVVFATLGFGVGMLTDLLQRERDALRRVVNAGVSLSTGADEAAIRQLLFDGLMKVAPQASVAVSDGDLGLLIGGQASAQGWQDIDARWRTQRLTSDGRDVGAVRWHFPGPEKEARNADEIAISLIALGASAIVRARLNLEKGDMELVARTEHLRTILLDAVSHHFRSPLAGILGSVTSILNLPDQHDGAVRRELLLIIKEQANRLSRYVDNFLSVARLESGSIDVNLSDLQIEPIIYDVWESFGEAGGARRFLQVQVHGDLVRTDPSLLAQILGNVLENAIKYSPEGSVVDVRSEIVGGRLVLNVADQGPGVPAASQDRIFERFFRSQGATKPGLGLGLYITRSLIQMVGGAVAARSRSSGETGLVVSLTLPLAESVP